MQKLLIALALGALILLSGCASNAGVNTGTDAAAKAGNSSCAELKPDTKLFERSHQYTKADNSIIMGSAADWGNGFTRDGYVTCSRGRLTGENLNYFYCIATSVRRQIIAEDGAIGPKESKWVYFVWDLTDAASTSRVSGDIYANYRLEQYANYYEITGAKLVEMRCE